MVWPHQSKRFQLDLRLTIVQPRAAPIARRLPPRVMVQLRAGGGGSEGRVDKGV